MHPGPGGSGPYVQHFTLNHAVFKTCNFSNVQVERGAVCFGLIRRTDYHSPIQYAVLSYRTDNFFVLSDHLVFLIL